jgi:hypothetical protein
VRPVDDDLLSGEASFVGRHIGPFAGIPPTGSELSLPFVLFVRFRDGLLRRLGRGGGQVGLSRAARDSR